MKSIKKSKLAVLIALAFLTVACAFAAFAIGNKTTAFAESYAITKEDGAQLRLNTEGGMRFRFTMDEATKTYVAGNETVKVQFLFAPTAFFNKGIAEAYGVKGFLENEAEDIYASADGSKYYVNGCLNVSLKNVALDFTCEARIVEVEADGVTVKNVVAKAQSDSRNLYAVVNRTLFLAGSYEKSIFDDVVTPYSAWFGTESYPVLVNSQAEYDSLVSKCVTAGNTSFANVSVAVDGSVTYNAADFAEAAGKPSVAAMHTVTFMDGENVYQTVKVKEGQTAIAPALNPTKDFDGVYTYKFSNWEGSLTEVTKDETVNAVYTKKAIIEDEIALWEAEGATNLGSTLNNADVIDTMGSANVYSAKGYYGTQIANGDIKTEPYVKFYLAFKTSRQVSLANSVGKNVTESEKWYYVCYEKAGDASWKFTVKPFGESDYLNTLKSGTIEYDAQYFSAGKASFTNMFKTWFWANAEEDREHIVYATDVWGVNIADVADDEIAAWKDAGATNLGSALDGNGVVTTEEKFGSQTVYKFAGAQYDDIANKNINVSEYTTLYLAFKTTQDVGLLVSGGTYAQKANTWYFVRYDKNADGSWSVTINVVANNKDTEKSITPTTPANLASTATFNMMFKMWNWSTKYDVYATDVWGVTLVDAEIAAWKNAGATNLGSALNDGVVTTEEKFGAQTVYKATNSTGYSDIANKNINASEYTTLYLAYKTTKQVGLTHSDGIKGQNVANTWYFVKYEKQADGSWKQWVKTTKENDWGNDIPAQEGQTWLSSTAKFTEMFKTWGWSGSYDVYATDVWGVK